MARHSALACRSASAWTLLLAIVVGGFTADLISKKIAFKHVTGAPVVLDSERIRSEPGYTPIPHHESVTAVPGRMLDFRLVLNSGAVFGIGAHQRWFFVTFSVIAAGIAVWIFGWRTTARQRWLHVGIALILAGALGNLWDRLMIGRVRDFLHMLPDRYLPFGLSWPGGSTEVWPWIFNLADVMLLGGMAIVLIDMWVRDTRARRAATDCEFDGPD